MAGVEPAPSYEKRILSSAQLALPGLTKRYEPVFPSGRQGIASASLV
jgi:hypothetical protein